MAELRKLSGVRVLPRDEKLKKAHATSRGEGQCNGCARQHLVGSWIGRVQLHQAFFRAGRDGFVS